ncbi:hypothetical protein [Demequina litorisediminis]|nr:hypothetical protein [Demequina litorisediminis]
MLSETLTRAFGAGRGYLDTASLRPARAGDGARPTRRDAGVGERRPRPA